MGCLAGTRVLIVEDDLELGALTQSILEFEGAKTVICHEAAGALESAWELDPHVILLDARLPNGSGAALGRTLRLRVPRAVQVLVSGDLREVEDWSRTGGLALAKPYDLDEFLELLERCCAQNFAVA